MATQLKSMRVVYKKVYAKVDRREVQVLATMVLPVGTRVRANIDVTGRRRDRNARKNRADQAYIAALQTVDTGNDVETAYAGYDNRFKYHVGKLVKVRNFATGGGVCDYGVHFFKSIEDAKAYPA